MERVQIVQNAISKMAKRGYNGEKIIVLGDTPRDIAAAKKAGAISVAVSTGTASYEELMLREPDLAVRNLKNYMAIVEKMMR